VNQRNATDADPQPATIDVPVIRKHRKETRRPEWEIEKKILKRKREFLGRCVKKVLLTLCQLVCPVGHDEQREPIVDLGRFQAHRLSQVLYEG
jgi:hypothetical protein